MNMVPNKKYRRPVFQVVLFFNLLIFACVSFADEEQIQEIKYPIEKLHETLINMMVLSDSTKFDKRYNFLKPTIVENFNIPLISKVILGRHWKTISKEEKDKFINLFNQLTITTYVSRFDSYKNQNFKNISLQKLKKNRYLIKTEFVRPKEKSVSFDYIVQKDKNGEKWRIISVIAEGVNDLSLKRAEYASIIKKYGFDGLIAKLEQKIHDSREN